VSSTLISAMLSVRRVVLVMIASVVVSSVDLIHRSLDMTWQLLIAWIRPLAVKHVINLRTVLVTLQTD